MRAKPDCYTNVETTIANSPSVLTALLKEAKMPSGNGFLLLLVPDCLHGKKRMHKDRVWQVR